MRFKVKCKLNNHNEMTLKVDATDEIAAIELVKEKYNIQHAEISNNHRFTGLRSDAWSRRSYPHTIRKGIYGGRGTVRVFS